MSEEFYDNDNSIEACCLNALRLLAEKKGRDFQYVDFERWLLAGHETIKLIFSVDGIELKVLLAPWVFAKDRTESIDKNIGLPEILPSAERVVARIAYYVWSRAKKQASK